MVHPWELLEVGVRLQQVIPGAVVVVVVIPALIGVPEHSRCIPQRPKVGEVYRLPLGRGIAEGRQAAAREENREGRS